LRCRFAAAQWPVQSAAVSGDRHQLTVQDRNNLGSAESRRLRRNGVIPGVLYGKDSPRPIAVQERALRAALTGSSGLHAVLDVVLEGQTTPHPSILKDYQQDPLRGKIAHVDLQEVRLDQPIQASVTVTLHGGEDSPGVREGGVLSQPTQEVTVEALPMEIPEHVELDVSGMEMGDTLRLSDIAAIGGVTLVDDPDTVIATVTAPTREIEPEEVEEEAVEGEEGAAAEGAPEGAAEQPAGEAAGESDTTEG
jgi:large subunit ribosomal protein L25